ncbi:MAG: helix-turn-helix domain-containing protein [Myxococcales bacterium]|nr:helix-turn-helix domain-containing protein [Myxococcales bacterium]
MGDLLDTLTLLGALQGAGLAAALSLKRANRVASRVLGALIAALALMLLLDYLNRSLGWRGHPHFLALGAPLPYLFTPLLYLYVQALVRPPLRFGPGLQLHALPFLGHAIYMMGVFYLQDAETKLALARAHVAGDVLPGMVFFMGVQILQAVAYQTAAYVSLRRYRRRMRDYYSDLTAIDLRWLLVMVLGSASVWAVVAAQYAAELFRLHIPGASELSAAVEAGSSLFIFLVGYIFLWQPELAEKAGVARRLAEGDDEPATASELAEERDPVTPGESEPVEAHATDAAPGDGRDPIELHQHPAAPVPAPSATRSSPRYQRNRLDDADASELVAALHKLMSEAEPFRDPALTVQDLADGLGVTAHQLSQLLNVRVGKTFYAFVSGHRADAMKLALGDPARADRGVLELALACGFNSKSTLNSTFKKHTGLTPTQYRKQQLQAGS